MAQWLIPGLFFLVGVCAHSQYRDLIPNGYSVPDPCRGGIWEAVGHYDPHQHTDDKNFFGVAFAAAGHAWTQDLCNADSDNDGRTNGEELGDPTCVWTQGDTPTGSASGHPGICEPVGSTKCAQDNFFCGCNAHACVVGK